MRKTQHKKHNKTAPFFNSLQLDAQQQNLAATQRRLRAEARAGEGGRARRRLQVGFAQTPFINAFVTAKSRTKRV